MASKRPSLSANSAIKKKTRTAVTLSTKVEVLRRFDLGEKAVDIGKALALPPTTVRTIRGNADKIKNSLLNYSSVSATKSSYTRNEAIEKTEKMLAIWIETQNQRNCPVNLGLIQSKALSLYSEETKNVANTSTSKEEVFTASRGWFQRFKARYGFHNIKMTGEAASSDTNAAQEFIPKLEQIIEDGGYTPKQIFNADETGLFWKRMPARTYIAKEERTAPGFKAAKDRVTVLLTANAAGDCKMKPLLITKSANPRALKGYSKEHLPVILKSNNKGWMTATLFQEWLKLYAIPAWKEYCSKANLDFKILLIIDNAPTHPPDLVELNENVKVVFVPPNTTAIMQPMDQGVIASFKAYYLRRTFKQLLEGTDGEDKPTIKEYWRSYNILHAIKNIEKAWSEVTEKCLNSVWGKLWPDCVRNFKGFEDSTLTADVRDDIISIAKKVGFDDLDTADIDEVLNADIEEFNNEELRQLALNPLIDTNPESEDDVPEERPDITTNDIASALNHIELALQIFTDNDRNDERSSKVRRNVIESVRCYEELLKERKKHTSKQATLHAFFKKQDDPPCGEEEQDDSE